MESFIDKLTFYFLIFLWHVSAIEVDIKAIFFLSVIGLPDVILLIDDLNALKVKIHTRMNFLVVSYTYIWVEMFFYGEGSKLSGAVQTYTYESCLQNEDGITHRIFF